MMKQVGFTYNLIKSEADFKKFADRYNDLLIATIIFLAVLRFGKFSREIVDSENFEMEETTFDSVMRFFVGTMVPISVVARLLTMFAMVFRWKKIRVYEEYAMFSGFLMLVLFLISWFGFLGIIWSLVSPPAVFLGFQITKLFWFRNVKASQDYIRKDEDLLRTLSFSSF